MNLEEVLNYRRSVRVFDREKQLDPEKVKHCLELATLAPNSSNMQLWSFIRSHNQSCWQRYPKPVLTRLRLQQLQRLSFLLHVRIYIGVGPGLYSILKEGTSDETVPGSVRKNVSRTENSIMES